MLLDFHFLALYAYQMESDNYLGTRIHPWNTTLNLYI